MGEHHEPKINIVKKAVEECYMVKNLKGAEEHHWYQRKSAEVGGGMANRKAAKSNPEWAGQ